MKKIRPRYIVLIALSAVVIIGSIIGLLFYFGYIWFNNPSLEDFPIRGLDISEHQREIDWEKVSKSHFDFIFIKATEGKDHQDGFFLENWENASKIGLARSAYHFFTFRSPGLEQARNFMAVVPNESNCLPPTIDIEFGGNSREIPERDAFRKELREFIVEIEGYFKRRPILYVTYESYERYIMGDFEDCVIWIRDLFNTPRLKDGRHWTFWQYNCRGRVDGINGYVDLDVFNGDEADFASLYTSSL